MLGPLVGHISGVYCTYVLVGRNTRVKIKPVWLSSSLKDMIKAKRGAFHRYKSNPIVQNEIYYKLIRQHLKKSIRKAKRQSEMKLAKECNGDLKKFYSYYKFKNKQKTVGPFTIGENVIHDDTGIVNVLNEQFVSVFTRENAEDIPNVRKKTNACVNDVDVSVGTIKSLLKELRENTACGPDEIYAKILKELAEFLALPLQILFKRSLYFSEIPSDWKCANVVPIFKGGGKTDPSNYRPVSLTSLVCKLFEKLVKSVIQTHLENENLLRNSQHGFRPGRSCLTNLLSFLDFTTSQYDQGKKLSIIYLDFCKAFDKVPHDRLILALDQHGIDGPLCKWIQNWLTGRKQRVLLNGHKSDWKQVLSGVPQGSVLGPLLFIIFVNEIDEGITSRIWKFADDIKLAGAVETDMDRELLQNDLNKIFHWTNTWQMTLNVAKCKVLNVGSRNTSSFYFEEHGLQEVGEEKDLGIYVTKDLKSTKQTDIARKKSLKMLGLLNRNVQYKSKNVMKKLYCAYVRPHLEYCVEAWHPVYKKDLKSLEKVQRKATKMVKGLKTLSYEDRLKTLKLHSLYYRRLRGDLIQLFKILKGFGPPELKTMFELNTIHTRGHSLKLRKKRTKLSQCQNFFAHRVVNQWNLLPRSVVDSSTLVEFKRNLDRFYSERGTIFKTE